VAQAVPYERYAAAPMPTGEFSESDVELWRAAHQLDPGSTVSLRNIQTWRRDDLIEVESPGASGRGLSSVYSSRAPEQVRLIEELMRKFKNRHLVTLSLFAAGYEVPLARVRVAYAAAYSKFGVMALTVWKVLNNPSPSDPRARELLRRLRKAAADKWWRQGFREIRRLSGGARRGVTVEGIRRSVFTQLLMLVLGLRLEPESASFDELLHATGLYDAYEQGYGSDPNRKTAFLRELFRAACLRTLKRTVQRSSLADLRQAVEVTHRFLEVLPIPSGDLEVALVAPVVAQFPTAQDGLVAISDYVRAQRNTLKLESD
jgi:hypothetical protein